MSFPDEQDWRILWVELQQEAKEHERPAVRMTEWDECTLPENATKPEYIAWYKRWAILAVRTGQLNALNVRKKYTQQLFRLKKFNKARDLLFRLDAIYGESRTHSAHLFFSRFEKMEERVRGASRVRDASMVRGIREPRARCASSPPTSPDGRKQKPRREPSEPALRSTEWGAEKSMVCANCRAPCHHMAQCFYDLRPLPQKVKCKLCESASH